MKPLNLKASHKSVRQYYEEIEGLTGLGISHEGAVSPAFASLLRHCAKQFSHTLVEKYPYKARIHTLFIDGALVDNFNLVHGFWEAKDTEDDLNKEIKKKFDAGYPKNNILFQAPDRIVIWQDNKKVLDDYIQNPGILIEALKLFFEYQPPAFEQWEQAVDEFKSKVTDIGKGLLDLIERERSTNTSFASELEEFTNLCRETINPNISVQAVEEMLIQHLLTERIFRNVFNNPDFVNRNTIAHEIEKVISALTSHYFSRQDFLKSLDRFYIAIESTASTVNDFHEKQHFLNTVYEKFFQGFSIRIADTHGIVYTPQPIVNFMVKSVIEILQNEFGRSLWDKGIHIIDPFVGTGNFIVCNMRELPRSKLHYKYNHELHCNEVMLLPYYISSMNIEHEYLEITGNYQPFEGICLVDTFDIGKVQQISLFSKENTARVKQQQNTPIFVIIGNPPYNAGQVNENDNNKNRKYPEIDTRVSQTYGKGSKATLLRKLNDPYVKAIRWATDRIKNEGVVAFVTNSSFVDGITFDGMRKHLAEDFDKIYILDLGGNVRENPKLSGTTHNVFGIQVGVSINIFIKKDNTDTPHDVKIYYSRVDEFWRKEQKYDFLNDKTHIGNINWEEIQPDSKNNWLTKGMSLEFDSLIPMGTKEAKASKDPTVETIFKTFSLGVATNRDRHVHNFHNQALISSVEKLSKNYNLEVYRYLHEGKPQKVNVDDFIDYSRVKWSSTLKNHLKSGVLAKFDKEKIQESLYRPFTSMFLYYDNILNDRPAHFSEIFPHFAAQSENRIIIVPSFGSKQVSFFMAQLIPDLNFFAGSTPIQCFPLYIYSDDGINQQENITGWALNQFQTHYGDNTISKQDIFNYIYAILNHPTYRIKYLTNLKRELPHIPFAPNFRGFAKAGSNLAELHVNYEKQAEYPLKWIEDIDAKVNYRVDKMKLSKDKTQIIYNDFVTLDGIPPEVFEYRLGNRSALDWIIDQYQVKTDKRSGITNDPNIPDDPQYIIRLIGKVITVSLETVQIVNSLPNID